MWCSATAIRRTGRVCTTKCSKAPTAGAAETVSLHAAEVAAGIFIVGWLEDSGMTITHVMNLNTSTVHAFWTYPTEPGRVAELHLGTLAATD